MQDMKLNDFYKMSFEEAIKQMDLVNMEVHTNEDGDVKALEMKYVPVPTDRALTPAPWK